MPRGALRLGGDLDNAPVIESAMCIWEEYSWNSVGTVHSTGFWITRLGIMKHGVEDY